MRNKNNMDVIKIFNHFQKSLLQKPSHKRMFMELRMMKFKIRPVQGDILTFDLEDEKLLELLWSLGKLDELYQKEYGKLSPKNKGIFVRLFDSMYQKFQVELNWLNLRKERKTSSAVEMEIFRDRQPKSKLN